MRFWLFSSCLACLHRLAKCESRREDMEFESIFQKHLGMRILMIFSRKLEHFLANLLWSVFLLQLPNRKFRKFHLLRMQIRRILMISELHHRFKTIQSVPLPGVPIAQDLVLHDSRASSGPESRILLRIPLRLWEILLPTLGKLLWSFNYFPRSAVIFEKITIPIAWLITQNDSSGR